MQEAFMREPAIRLGIWGLGRGSNFIKAAKALNIEVVAGCDSNPVVREKFLASCPDAFVTGDEEEFLALKNLDAVLIATFFPSHAGHAIRVLEAGLHVMCEVTSFFTPAEGVQLVEAAEKSGKVYNLLENYPFTKENMFLTKLWEKGFFGEFLYGEFDYLHECRLLSYGYNLPGTPPVEPGYTAHSWRSWLDMHYYNTHSLGPVMKITGLRPETVTALPGEISLPGFLPGSGMGCACPSLIRMSNGGLFRNLTGGATGDSHTGKRIWGTRASAESLEHGLYVQVGASGNGLKLAVEPEWPVHGELAETAGHGGGDFWELYYFAREIRTGIPAPWDLYSSCDVTLAGMMAARSKEEDGKPIEIPDFRCPETRERYRHDDWKKDHFDPSQIFPSGHDSLKTGNFAQLMLSLCRDMTLQRSALDGAQLYSHLKNSDGRLAVIKALEQARRNLPEAVKHREEALKLIALYPDSPAAQALSGILGLQEPDWPLDGEAICQEIQQLITAKIR